MSEIAIGAVRIRSPLGEFWRRFLRKRGRALSPAS